MSTEATTRTKDNAPISTLPERTRVVLVDQPNQVQSEELYGVLRRRLVIFIGLLAGLFCFSVVLVLWVVVRDSLDGTFETLGGWGRVGLALGMYSSFTVVFVALALVVAWRPPSTQNGLRWIELLVLAVVVGFLLFFMATPWFRNFWNRAAEASRFDSYLYSDFFAEWICLRWFACIIGYGTLIPNTWRRCAVVVSILGLCPILAFLILAGWDFPLSHKHFQVILNSLVMWISVAIALVVFTAYRVDILYRQVLDARRLGQYVLGERLGVGGMGEVYRAEHVRLRRPCAIKVIRPERANNPLDLELFEREVQLTATLTHPNTVQVFDYGRSEDGTFYYVMEYLSGLTLQQMVDLYGPLPPARAVSFLRQLCAALREAHGRKLIHRDIKPSNVMVCIQGGVPDVVKLLDFGVVLPLTPEPGRPATDRSEVIVGTASYIAPEQARCEATIDHRADIYCLGGLAYFLLSGQVLFPNRAPWEMVAAHLSEQPVPLSIYRPDVGADLEAIVHRCLAKNPADRYPDVVSLDSALRACHAADTWTEPEASAWWERHSPPLPE